MSENWVVEANEKLMRGCSNNDNNYVFSFLLGWDVEDAAKIINYKNRTHL